MYRGKFRRRLQCLSAAMALLCTTSVAAVECRPWSEADEAEPASLEVGEIEIKNNDIFNLSDYDESRAIHRLANRLHIQTRESVVAAQLLFETGQPYAARVLRETERRLRSNPYIHSASVTPVRVCGKRVDILVETYDNWSLTPSVAITRSGGFTSYAVRLKEANLLGYGKSVQVSGKRTIDRDTSELRYDDRQLFGSRYILHLAYQDNSDGSLIGVETGKPFDGLTGRRSWSASALHREYEQSLYEASEVVAKFGIDEDSASFRYRWSYGLKNGVAVRPQVGWTFDDKTFSDVDGFENPTGTDERVLSFPFVGARVIQEDFVEGTNLFQMGAVEDVSLGHNAYASIGFTSEAFGATEEGLVFNGQYAKGLGQGPYLGLFSASARGLLGEEQVDNGELYLAGKWFIAQSRQLGLYLLGDLKLGHRLYPENIYTIGGDTGLRGYPLRMQSGDRRFLFTVEQRYFFDWYPYRLVRFGAAVFADAGSAWFEDQEQNTLTDVGFGFRLVSTRQTEAKILHIDFAFPQNERDQVDSFQLIIEAKSAF